MWVPRQARGNDGRGKFKGISGVRLRRRAAAPGHPGTQPGGDRSCSAVVFNGAISGAQTLLQADAVGGAQGSEFKAQAPIFVRASRRKRAIAA